MVAVTDSGGSLRSARRTPCWERRMYELCRVRLFSVGPAGAAIPM